MSFIQFNNLGLNTYSDPAFMARAYEQYVRSRANNVSALFDIMNTPPDDEALRVISYVHQLMNDKGWASNAQIGTIMGMVRVDGLIMASWLQLDSDNPALFSIQLHDLNGVQLPSTTSLDEYVSSLIDDFQSMVASAGAIKASISENLSDRLQVFNQYMETAANYSDSVGASISYYKSMLTQGLSTVNIFSALSTDTNVNNMAENGSSELFADANIVDITGASPIGPLSFDGIVEAGRSAARIGATVVKGLFNAATSLISTVASKAVKVVKEVTVDPDDLSAINNDENFGVVDVLFRKPAAGTATFGPDNLDVFYNGVTNTNAKFPDLDVTAIRDQMFNHFNGHNVYSVRTIFGEIIMRPKLIDFGINIGHGAIMSRIWWKLDKDNFNVMIRPRTLNPAGMAALKGIVVSDESTSAAFQNKVRQILPILYDCSGLTEGEKYASLSASWTRLSVIAKQYNPWKNGRCDQLLQSDFPIAVDMADRWLADFDRAKTNTYTNADFVALANARAVADDANIANFVFGSLFGNYLERKFFPIDYSFLAYGEGIDSVAKPGWRVKTDTENREAFNTAMTTAITAGVVIALCVTVGVAAKKIATKRAFRREQAKATLDSKMWSGQTLTSEERRQYRRCVRKGGVSSLFEKRIPSSGGLEQPTDYSSVLGEVITLIQGSK